METRGAVGDKVGDKVPMFPVYITSQIGSQRKRDRAEHHHPDWETHELSDGDKLIGDIGTAGHHHLERAGHL